MSRIAFTSPAAPARSRTPDTPAKPGRPHSFKAALRGVRNCFKQLKSVLQPEPKRDTSSPAARAPRYSAEVRNERASLAPLMLLKTTLAQHPLSPNTFQKANALVDQAVADGATLRARQSVFREVAILYPDSDFEQDLADIQHASQESADSAPEAMEVFESDRILHLLAHIDDLSLSTNRLIADAIMDHFTSLPYEQGQQLLSRLALRIRSDQTRWEALNPATAEFLYHTNDNSLVSLTEGIDPEQEQSGVGPRFGSSAASVLLLDAWCKATRLTPAAATFDSRWARVLETTDDVSGHIRLIRAALEAQYRQIPLLHADASLHQGPADLTQSSRSDDLLQEATHQAFKRASTGQLPLQRRGDAR
ncbi:hypothetical protein [uncultured Stenotrophomonas sp.]|uniref:hypothetical protein n=1 Tax=uncultured Stenotrophomonas sp. TaxID=165438 RepID=UPI0025ED074C|nr:hypothetical protein [uncultured Stenotrophomonas sp.]